MSELLLEIGLEEVPAAFMPRALTKLKEEAETAFQEIRLDYGEIRTLGTPRRLALLVSELADQQNDLVEEVRGPSKKAAYDAEGEATKALQGFMRGNDVKTEDLFEKGDYVFAQRKQSGKSTETVLKTLLPELIRGLTFPKMMRWGAWETRYVRPIHWIVALLDDKVIPFELEMCQSGRLSRGHRFLGEANFAIAAAASYEEALAANYVIVDQNKRRSMIQEQIDDLVDSVEGKQQEDPALLEEVVYLVEYPTALMGQFAPRYLDMPKELVITPMKEHQRYFPVLSADGSLLTNRFITVRNGNDKHLDVVVEGNERVLAARLADARFFYDEDLKVNPEDWLEKLKNVVFQDSLGSIYDKTMRNKALAEKIALLLRLAPTFVERAKRAAHLAKTDLVSQVVTEFPELQGLSGEVYINAYGEDDEEIAQAVREHYLPRFSGDAVPQSEIGQVVALADKLDTIAGCFAVGIEPTGSQDPYGLRRQSAGVLNILLSQQRSVSLKSLISLAIEGLPEKLVGDAGSLVNQIYSFFDQRMRTLLRDAGYEARFTEAILNTGYDDPYNTMLKAKAINEYMLSHEEDFKNILLIYKRAHNLSQKADQMVVKPELFEEEAEANLYKAICDHVNIELTDAIARLTLMSSLQQSVEAFFEQVMVMDERPDVRRNRLALLRLFTDITSGLIDLSVL